MNLKNRIINYYTLYFFAFPLLFISPIFAQQNNVQTIPSTFDDYPIVANLDSLETAVQLQKSNPVHYLHGLITLELNRRTRSNRFSQDFETIKILSKQQGSEIALNMLYYLRFFKTYQNNLEESAQTCLKCVNYFERTNDTLGMVSTYYQIVLLNQSLLDNVYGDRKTAKYYFDKMRALTTNSANPRTKLTTLNLTVIRNDLVGDAEDITISLKAFQEAIEIIQKNPVFSYQLGTLYTNIGTRFWYKKRYKELLEYHLKAYELSANLDCDKIITSIYNLGNAYRFNSQFEPAEHYYKEAIKRFQECHYDNIELLTRIHIALSKLFHGQKRYEESWYYKTLSDSLNTVVFSRLRSKNLIELQTKYETEKKELENKRLLLEAEKQQERNSFLSFIAVFMLILLLIIFYVYRKIRTKNAELTRLNELTASQNKHLTLANQRMENFTNTLSHDALGYINHILNYTILGQNLAQQPELQPIFQKTVRYASNLKRMSENLIGYNKMQKTTKSEHFDLNEVFVETIEDMVFDLAKPDINLIINELPAVYANREFVKEVVRNLMNNAIKFRRPDVHLDIEISSAIREDNRFVEIQIKDNGIGISDEEQRIIFNEFAKGDPYAEGSGLGLFICRQIIESMGGRIWVESQLGVGTTFFFTLTQKQELIA